MTDYVFLQSIFARIKASAQAAGVRIITAHQPRPPLRNDVTIPSPMVIVDYMDRIEPHRNVVCAD